MVAFGAVRVALDVLLFFLPKLISPPRLKLWLLLLLKRRVSEKEMC